MKKILFCCTCLASTNDSSWGGQVIAGHCFNCGASGSTFELLECHAESIQRNASWVGKRYYPSEEDKQTAAELRLLRSKMTSFPGRYAVPARSIDRWNVTQWLSDGKTITVSVTAVSAEDALDIAKTMLPYVEEC